MNDRQENRFSAAIKVQSYLGNAANAAAFAPVTAIADHKLLLDSYIQGIVVNNGIATSDTTGFAIAKENAKNALVKSTLRLTRGMMAHATVTEDPMMLKLVDFTPTELNRKRDSELYTTCRQMNETAAPLVPALAPYLVQPAHLATQGTDLDTYFATLPTTSTETDRKAIANDKVDELMDTMYTMLKTKMDVFVNLFIDDEPELVAGYYMARAIDDTGSSGGGGNGGGGGGGGATQEFSGPVPAMSFTDHGPLTFVPTAQATLQTTTPTALRFQLLLDGTPTGDSQALPGNTTVQMNMGAMASGGNGLRVTNDSPVPGEFSVSIA